jgi:hypothetical protein
MTKYICSKVNECKLTCPSFHHEEHYQTVSCNTPCTLNGAPPDAVCIPVPELVICEAKGCHGICEGEHNIPHAEKDSCEIKHCGGRYQKCVPYPLSPKENKPLYIIGMHGLALDICDLYDDKSAHEEAFKLAEVHPGRKVYLLEAKEYCIQESQPVIWREVK